jgi:hypothetical protein
VPARGAVGELILGQAKMTTFFMFCALVGGALLLCQLVMTLIGLGHADADVTDPGGGWLAPTGDSGTDLGDLSDTDAGGPQGDGHGSSWLFGIISFRTLVAAATFFGLAGMTAQSSGAPLAVQLLSAIISGGLAMLGVHALMRLLLGLGQSGTLQLTNAIGKSATVSVAIPGGLGRHGKVRLTVQGRLEELTAVALNEESLTTGSQVIVVDVIQGNVLQVAPLRETS